MSDRARRVMVKRRAILAGVPQDGHPHPWHHPVGTVMDRQITDIRGVQKRLGPVDLSATLMDTHSVDDEGEHVMKALYLGEERVEEPPMSVGDQPSDRRDTVRPSELVPRLRELDEELPDACYAQLLAAGAAIVPDLLAVLEDALVDEPVADGWAPVHAVRLLGVLGDARAVPALVRGLARDDKLALFAQQITDALLTLGLCAIDGCLEAYATTDDDTRDSLAFVLGRCGMHDERIYAVLLDTLERSPELGANGLVDYGDPRALAALSQRFDALPIRDEGSPVDNHVFVELRCAIEDLGGHLTGEQAAKAERADAPRRRFVAQLEGMREHAAAPPPRVDPAWPPPAVDRGTFTRKPRKLGRNAPCWCGSGKKYKKGHLDLERH